jgi:hypothetical protein
MTERLMSQDELDEIRETVVDSLLVLANVAQGDCSTQLDVDIHSSNPLTFLLAGINDLIMALGTEQEQSKVFRTELDDRLATIEQQRSAIRSLSTPVIEVWRGVLCLPVTCRRCHGHAAQRGDDQHALDDNRREGLEVRDHRHHGYRRDGYADRRSFHPHGQGD